MKKILILFFSINVFFLFSQESETEKSEIYIVINNKNFVGANNLYLAYFSLKSTDERFRADHYSFNINDDDIVKDETLYEMGNRLDLKNIKYVKPEVEFDGMTSYEVHIALSLYKNIYIVTKIPKGRMTYEKDQSKKYLLWRASYNGTVKDRTYIQLSSKTPLERL